ncbi:uncharacterized protein B0H18DRAFT_955577 [Fomitopsis serialis]|uniref:uncharacterized protein n=1 Tax=Fomitopsis serialis TaxID=139415 RepID=UPI0020079133|nr:uncharacterized protein B0H18DRAFT_955577 [Neoantrodia serialis]KAH9924181.1 hypothetical protein B0H18DRAFT_955577 [Neoantrodia serialis]
MSSYLPLQSQEPDTPDIDEAVKRPLLNAGFDDPEQDQAVQPASKRKSVTDWITLVLAVFLLGTSFALYIDSTHVITPRSAKGLRKPDPYPGLSNVPEYQKKRKGPMVRTNKAMPDEEYTSSSHIVLSENDSMFYQFRMKPNAFKWCYVDAVVPTPERGAEAGKTFTGSGNLLNIQVWNTSYPQQRMEGLSWNSRPERLELLGTVSWMPEKERMEKLEWEDGWQLKPQTPRFDCSEKKWFTFEVSCDNCTLEFEQIFSDPPMAFDVLQIA